MSESELQDKKIIGSVEKTRKFHLPHLLLPHKKGQATEKQAAVSTVGKQPSNLLGRSRKFWLVVLIIVCGALGTAVLVANRFLKPINTAVVAFTINGQAYSRSEYKKESEKPENLKLTPKKFKDSYISIAKIRYAAQKTGININPTDLEEAATQLYKDQKLDSLSVIKKEEVYKTAVQSYILKNGVGGFAGYLFVFPFQDKIPQDSAEPIPGAGDEVAIEKDRQYAKDRTDYYYEQLSKKLINNDEALTQIKKDDRLRYFNAFNDSNKFESTSILPWEINISPQIATYIKTLTKQGLSDIKTDKILNTKTNKIVDAKYYFVNLTKVGISKVSLQESYEKILKSLNVKLYV